MKEKRLLISDQIFFKHVCIFDNNTSTCTFISKKKQKKVEKVEKLGKKYQLHKMVQIKNQRVGGWMGGWMKPKAGLRIAYFKQTFNLDLVKFGGLPF